jgi:imidazolonepropionase-like amidohydrolase
MNFIRTIGALFVFQAVTILSPAQAQQVIDCGQVLDVISGETLGRRYITVQAGEIVQISETAPENATNIEDLSTSVCGPGLIDLHVHLALLDATGTPAVNVDAATRSLRSLKAAQQMLHDGYTTLRTLGDDQDFETVSLRDAINDGLFPGPRLLVAANAYTPENVPNSSRIFQDVIAGQQSASEAVETEFNGGSDWVKTLATVGVGLTEREIEQLISETHRRGMKIAVHASPIQVTGGRLIFRQAVIAGADTIEHGIGINEEDIDLMVEHKTWFIPTIGVIGHMIESPFVKERPETLAMISEWKKLHYPAVRLAYDKGVRMGIGSDVSFGPNSENWALEEFTALNAAVDDEWFVLRAGTIVAAEILGLDEIIGSLQVGKRADIIAFKSSPIDDMEAIKTVHFVMRDGTIIRKE